MRKDLKLYKKRVYETIKHEFWGKVKVAWYGKLPYPFGYDERGIGVVIRRVGPEWEIIVLTAWKTHVRDTRRGKEIVTPGVSSMASMTLKAPTRKDAEKLAEAILRHAVE